MLKATDDVPRLPMAGQSMSVESGGSLSFFESARVSLRSSAFTLSAFTASKKSENDSPLSAQWSTILQADCEKASNNNFLSPSFIIIPPFGSIAFFILVPMM
jgi:hypothetical protein